MNPSHRIHRAAIDLHSPDLTDTAGVRDWCREVLLEELDAALSEFCPEGQVLVLDSLHLNLALPDGLDAFSAETKTALRQQIRQHLQTLSTTERRLSVSEYQARIVLRYLQSGTLPERYSEAEWSELKDNFLDATAQNKLFFNELITVISDRNAFTRWYALLGEPALLAWLDAAVPLPSVQWEAIFQRLLETIQADLSSGEYSVPALFWKIVPFLETYRTEPERRLAALVYSLVSPERLSVVRSYFVKKAESADPDTVDVFLKTVFQSIESLPPGRSVPENNPIAGPVEKPALLDSGIVTPVAGLVLTASFVPPFLRSLGLVGPENRLVDPHRLPMLLYFVATGQTEAEEWELALPKILCGLPLSETCDTMIAVSDKEKSEVQTLLTTVIEHWQRLGNTSPDGLRGTFLQRTGRLTVEKSVYRLTIPEETVDILLSFVPWSFRLVRFSWMERLLIVEWS